jgi:hypothetical protein
VPIEDQFAVMIEGTGPAGLLTTPKGVPGDDLEHALRLVSSTVQNSALDLTD